MNIDARAIHHEFRETDLVSDTPLYLYQRLRRLPAVQYLATAMGGDQLVAEYQQHVATKNRTAADVAAAYICLVILTQDPREAASLLRLLDLTSLDWAAATRDLYLAKMPAGQVHQITVRNLKVPTVRLGTDASISSGSTGMPRPKVQPKANL